MWHVKNLDLVVNTLGSAHADDNRRLAPIFLRFLKLARKHPCKVASPRLTNMHIRDNDGDHLVLHLPDGWYVAFMVQPNCDQSAGLLAFDRVGRFEAVAT